MKHSTRLRIRVLLFGIWTVLSMIPGCGRKEEQKQSAMATDVPVSVTLCKMEKLESNLSLVGNINASADVNVISQTQGPGWPAT